MFKFCMSRRGGRGGGGWGHLKCDMHNYDCFYRLGGRNALVGTGLANFLPHCTNGLGKCNSDLVGALILAKNI